MLGDAKTDLRAFADLAGPFAPSPGPIAKDLLDERNQRLDAGDMRPTDVVEIFRTPRADS